MAVSLSWTVTVTNTSDTAATVKVVLKAKSTYGSYNNNSRSGYITIDGTKYTFSHSFKANTTTTIATKSKSISRTTSSKSVSIKASYSTGVSSGTVTKSGSTTVSARPTYTVTFNANGGTGGKSVSVYSGYTTTFPTTSRTGYTFGSWNGYAQGAATPAITSSRTYTASWTINTYAVTLNAQSGTLTPSTASSKTKTYGTALPLPNENNSTGGGTITRTGYYFGGWWTGTNGTGTNYGTSYTANAAATLYAKWTLNQYIITFNSDGGSAVANMTKTHGSSVSLPTPTKEGYTFAGWKYGTTNIGTTCSINGSSNNAQIALVAVWNANAKRVILHYYESATDINSTAVVYKIKDENYNLNNIELPDVSNYIFKGWYTSSNFTTKVTTLDSSYDSASYPTTEVIDLYAKWNPTYNIVFNPNPLPYEDGIDVVGYVAPIIVENGISTPLPSYTNYTYKSGNETKATAISWNSAANGSGTTYTNSIQLTGLTAGATYNLYAQWRRESFTQTFTRGEATSGNNYTITANYYDTINLPTAQSGWVYDQHSFSHWILQKDNTGHIYNESFLVTENNTFVAQWTSKYTAPQINITAIRTVDEEGEFPSESGRYVKINLSGQNGEYENVSVTNYTYSIEAKFFNSEGTEIQTIKQSYEKGTTQTINEIKIFNDKKFTYDSCIITFIDTTNYNDLLPLDDSNRIYIYSFQIPLTRGIAIHIADDLSAIGVLGELNENDKGLVVKELSYFKKDVNIDGRVYTTKSIIVPHGYGFKSVTSQNTETSLLYINSNDAICVADTSLNTIIRGANISINSNNLKVTNLLLAFYPQAASSGGIAVYPYAGQNGGVSVYKGDDTSKAVRLWYNDNGNHGVWSDELNSWLIHNDGTNTYIANSIRINSQGQLITPNSIYMPNGCWMYMRNADDTAWWPVITSNSSNAFTYGYGSYNNSAGSVYYDGYDIHLRYKNRLYISPNGSDSLFKDWIIEESVGTAVGTWYYRRYYSGLYECWGRFTEPTGATTADATGYRSPGITPPNFPHTFSAIPVIQATFSGAGANIGWAVAITSTTTSSAGKWCVYRLNSNTSAKGTINLRCIGKW